MNDKQKQTDSIEAFAESFSNKELISQVRRNCHLLAKTVEKTHNLKKELDYTIERMRLLLRQLNSLP